MSVSHADKPVSRRTVVAAGAWSLPAVLATGALPAFAASPGSNPAVGYAALLDSQSAETNTSFLDGPKWPHGKLTRGNANYEVRFTLGMKIQLYNTPAYNVYPYDVYKEWVSGNITVKLRFNNRLYSLISQKGSWVDVADLGAAWTWSSTNTAGDWTTLTFTHSPISFYGNATHQDMSPETGMFQIDFKWTAGSKPAVIPTPGALPAGKSATDSMTVQVDSDLSSGNQISYVQEDNAFEVK